MNNCNGYYKLVYNIAAISYYIIVTTPIALRLSDTDTAARHVLAEESRRDRWRSPAAFPARNVRDVLGRVSKTDAHDVKFGRQNVTVLLCYFAVDRSERRTVYFVSVCRRSFH